MSAKCPGGTAVAKFPPKRLPGTASFMTQPKSDQQTRDEEQMLLDIRDQLYGGSWDAFLEDLTARIEGRPYVFEVGRPSPRLEDTIQRHLQLIRQMQQRDDQAGLDPQSAT